MEKETVFYVLLSIRTAAGFESYGQFFACNVREFATALFRKLKGKEEVDEKTVLTCELMETKKGLPLNLQIISCSLEEMAENCKIIIKETFRLLNLEEF